VSKFLADARRQFDAEGSDRDKAPAYEEPPVNDATGDVDGSGDGSFDAWA
jgi:hypothetical protein